MSSECRSEGGGRDEGGTIVKKLLLAAAIVAAIAPIGAQAGNANRSESGTVALPAAAVPGVGLLTRQVRCGWTEAGINDVFGHVTTLTAEEGDGTHKFTISGGGADWDVVFYAALNTCDAGAVTTGSAETAGVGESAVIPEGTTVVISVFKSPGANVPFAIDIN